MPRQKRAASQDLINIAEHQAAINKLHQDLGEAYAERDRAQNEQDDHEAKFRAAHESLVHLPLRPAVSKAERLAAYDHRVAAGHAWHPHRQRLREANRWIKAIMEDLKSYE